MSITIKYDKILDELREGDSVPDPLNINNLSVNSLASFNTLYANNAVISSATLGTAHVSNIDWNLTSGATLPQEGQMKWSQDLGTTVLGLAGGTVDVALGMENVFPRRVRNDTGTSMPKGTVVYINGANGNTPTIARALATGDSTSAYTLGMTAETINDGATGWITTFGEITGIDLSTFSIGDTLYLSGATAGLFTNTAPQAPIHYVRVGTVVKATADGSLVVNVINGFEVSELHDVQIVSLASGNILQRDGSLWKNFSLATLLQNNLGDLAFKDTLNFTDLVTYPSLGSLAFRNSLNFTDLVTYPSLGSLAGRNSLNFTDLVTYPSLGSLAIRNSLNFTDLVTYPSLGSLAIRNSLNFTDLVTYPSLGSLAFRNSLNFTDLITYPSLGSLARRNSLNFTDLVTYPSLGSLAIRNSLNFTDLVTYPSLGSLAIRNSLNFTDLITYPSLGSLAIRNSLNFTDLVTYPSLGSLAIRNSLALSNLSDTSILSVASGQFLIYAGASWKNSTIPHNALVSLAVGDPHTQYARLAGRSGGQTFIGGTGTTDDLILRATSGAGTTGSVVEIQTGNNGAQFTRFDHLGNVGIGTSPTYKFSIDFANTTVYSSTALAGDGIFLRNLNSSATGSTFTQLRFQNSSTNGSSNAVGMINLIQPTNASPDSNFAIQLRNSSANYVEVMRMLSSGNIGLSETDPLGKLHIVTGQNSIILEKESALGTAVGPFIYAQQNGQTTAGATDSEFGFIVAGVGSTNTSQGPAFLTRGNNFSRLTNQRGTMFFSAGNVSGATGSDGAIIFSAGPTERVRITPAGYVGINTTAPATVLDVRNNTSTAYANTSPTVTDVPLLLSNSANTNLVQTGIQFNITGDSQNRIAYLGAVKESSTNRRAYLVFATDDGSNRDERVRIDPDGRVGIRTTAPSEMLEVYGSGLVDTSMIVHQSGESRGGISALTTQRVAFTTTDQNDDLVFGYSGSPITTAGFVERMRIDNGTGNIGVGIAPVSTNTGFTTIEGGDSNNFSLVAFGKTTNSVRLYANAYVGASSTQYKNTGTAGVFISQGNEIYHYGVASGSADASINFTQTLQLGLGTSLALQGATSQTGTGITFPATQNASSNANTLDDYEEGSWTPTYVASTTGFGAITYNIQVGRYVKIGQQVIASFTLRTSAVSLASATGQVRVAGLPFTVQNITNYFPSGSLSYSATFATNRPNGILGVANTQQATLYYKDASDGDSLALAPTDISTGVNGNYLIGTIEYIV